MKLALSRHIFEKFSNVRFHENPYIGSRFVPYDKTDRWYMTKLFVAFCNFAKALIIRPKGNKLAERKNIMTKNIIIQYSAGTL